MSEKKTAEEEKKKELDELIERIGKKLTRIKAKLLVMSGKGGVGKTFVATSIALYLKKMGYDVALYDADETGAADPYVLGERKASVYRDVKTGELVPVTTRHGLKMMSIEPLLPDDSTPLVWMGPLRTRFLLETLAFTQWGEHDFMVIDLPPGTGDEAITLAQVIPPPRYAIIVSTPGVLAENVVRKAIVFCRKTGIPILGLIENMSYFECPGQVRISVLGKSTAEELSLNYDIPVLGSIPLDPRVRESHDLGKPIYELAPNSSIDKAIQELTENIVKSLRAQGIQLD
jgi:ATP-binding protein involved in chromosome partitioning